MFTWKKVVQAATVLLLGAAMVRCTGAGGTDALSGASDLTISGTLGSSFVSSVSGKPSDDVRVNAITLADLEIYAIAFTTPPAIGQANVNADGSFTVSLAGAKGSQVMAVFRNKTSLVSVGTVKFQDNSKKDMDGNTQKSESITLADNVNLGAIAINADGEVVVDVDTISSAVSTTPPPVSAALDLSGNWTITPFEGTLPTGYVSACPVGTPDNQCHGPKENENVFLIGLKGVELDAQGNETTTPVYGLSFWKDSATVNACGNVIGFTDADSRTNAKIALTMPVNYMDGATQRSVGFGDAFTFTTPTGFGGDTCGTNVVGSCNLAWMKTAAKAKHDMWSCDRISVEGKTASVCKMVKASSPDVYSAHIEGGGCVDANNKPVMISNWGSLTPAGSCTENTTGVPAGFKSWTCPYTLNSAAISCTNTHGNFSGFDGSALSGALTNQDMTGYNPEGNVVANTTYCKDIVNNMTRYRCYAESYWDSKVDEAGCFKRYHFNWGATSIANFVVAEGRNKPDGNHMTERVIYSPDGTSGVVSGKETEHVSVKGAENSETICETERSQILSFKKVSDVKVLVDMKTKTRLVNSSNATCAAAAANTACETGGGENCEVYYRLKDGGNALFYINK